MKAEFEEYSFSTSWNWRGSDSGTRVIEEILALGFDSVELNYKITSRMLETIRPYIEQGRLKVPSVHNVFPFFDDGRFDTDSRLLGYQDEALRRQAVDLTITSVDAAHALGARVLVVHPGVVPHDDGPPVLSGLTGAAYDVELKRLWLNTGSDSAPYRRLFTEFAEYRRTRMDGELERILHSLETVLEYIVRKNIPMQIGLENRPMGFQIPDFSEMNFLLDSLSGAPIGLWFDTGHGAMLRHMGFFDDRAETAALADRLVGMHIHDVRGVDDHFAPYTQEGLDAYLDLIHRSPLNVIELGVKNSSADILTGMRRLQDALHVRFGEVATSNAVAAPSPAKAGNL